MTDINKQIAHSIQEIRKKQGIKAVDIAERLGISEAAYSQLETGKIQITVVRLYHISQELKVPLHSLLPDAHSHIQINRDSSHNNVIGTQINQADPSVKEMFQMILEKVGK